MENIQAYLTLADYQILISKDEHIYLNLDVVNKIILRIIEIFITKGL